MKKKTTKTGTWPASKSSSAKARTGKTKAAARSSKPKRKSSKSPVVVGTFSKRWSSISTRVKVLAAVFILTFGVIGTLKLLNSNAATYNLSKTNCTLLGRVYQSDGLCTSKCVPGAGAYRTANVAWAYCSNAISRTVSASTCKAHNRVYAVGEGCARRWQQTNAINAPQCLSPTYTYIVVPGNGIDYCKSPSSNGSGSTTTTPPRTTPASKRFVFFVPHQDDESLSMGTAIAKATSISSDVNVVLFTDGTASGARTGTLCKTKGYCLSPSEFSAARNREFVAALNRLGVATSHIHFENKPDGGTTSAMANSVVDKYIAKFGYNASYLTMSWLDAHPDHFNLGYALNNRCVYQKVASCSFLQGDYYIVGTGISNGSIPKVATPRGSWQYPTSAEKAKVVAALNEYKRWDPANGRYAIGYYSVATAIDYSIAHPEDWSHMNNSYWANSSQREAAVKWISKYQ